ncbi:MAG TPA: hypothetical protein VN616_15620 [Puia sp.]|nr:hypothetical protein [Puia sp.]
MSNRLEQFVHDHRDEFDGDEPDGKIWEAIRKDMGLGEDPTKKKPGSVVRLYRAALAVAAAVLVLIGGTVWIGNSRKPGTQPQVAANQPVTRPQPARSDSPVANPGRDEAQTANPANPEGGNGGAIRPDSKANEAAELRAEQNEEMYHYAKLVEIKQQQLKTIEKDEPLLYKKFSMDVDKLDSAYHGLQAQLTRTPNREQILEAMLQNLQLQMGLLNHQLDIIKQINHSKKTAYEKAYKTT